jgi:tRNA-binding EMAP/Myf-like protein
VLPARQEGKTLLVTDLLVGVVLEANDHPGSRGPSYLLRIDLGPRGERQAQMEPGSYAKDDLVGRHVVVSLEDEAIVVCARSHAHGPVLVVPDGEVEPGTVVA